jgi:hypothetical protein
MEKIMLVFDDDTLRETAEMLFMINPYTQHMSIDEIVQHMKRTASESLTRKLGYVSTLGYVLTAYSRLDGDIGVKASIASYTLKEYIQKRNT